VLLWGCASRPACFAGKALARNLTAIRVNVKIAGKKELARNIR
jgi:hypothetical protein